MNFIKTNGKFTTIAQCMGMEPPTLKKRGRRQTKFFNEEDKREYMREYMKKYLADPIRREKKNEESKKHYKKLKLLKQTNL